MSAKPPKIMSGSEYAKHCAHVLEVAKKMCDGEGSFDKEAIKLVGFALNYSVMSQFGLPALQEYRDLIGYSGDRLEDEMA